MKRLLLSLVLLTALVVSPLQVHAAHYWKVTMSDPTTTNQTRSFNVDFVALSTEQTDQITVRLLENDAEIDTKTTIGGGDSGTFNVTVPADGSYTYKLSSTSSDDGTTQETGAKQVTVVTPVEGEPSEVTSTDVGGDGTVGDQAQIGEDGSEDGTVQAEATSDGTVDGEAAATSSDQEDSEEDDSTTTALLYGLGTIAVLGIGYYLYAAYRARNIE